MIQFDDVNEEHFHLGKLVAKKTSQFRIKLHLESLTAAGAAFLI